MSCVAEWVYYPTETAAIEAAKPLAAAGEAYSIVNFVGKPGRRGLEGEALDAAIVKRRRGETNWEPRY
jgi:hypothetical protein